MFEEMVLLLLVPLPLLLLLLLKLDISDYGWVFPFFIPPAMFWDYMLKFFMWLAPVSLLAPGPIYLLTLPTPLILSFYKMFGVKFYPEDIAAVF